MLDDVLRQLPSLMDTVNQAATSHIRALSKWEKNTSSMSKAAIVIDFLGAHYERLCKCAAFRLNIKIIYTGVSLPKTCKILTYSGC